jgi:hypothetical protein
MTLVASDINICTGGSPIWEGDMMNVANAFDRNTSTSTWSDDLENNEMMIGYDFKRLVSIAKIRIYTAGGYEPGNASSLIVQANNSGSTWNDIQAFTGLPTAAGWQEIVLSNKATYKRWRVKETDTTTEKSWTIAEMEMYECYTPNFHKDIYDVAIVHFNNSNPITDSCKHTITKVGTGVMLDYSNKKFRAASCSLGGSGFLKLSNPTDFYMGNQNFTAEAWIYFKDNGTYMGILSYCNSTTNAGDEQEGFTISVYRMGDSDYSQTKLMANFNYGSRIQQIISNILLPVKQWVHVALERYGNTLYLYQNGVIVGTTDVTGLTMNSFTTPIFSIGAKGELGQTGGMYNFIGNIDEVRVSKGIARYRGQNFTPFNRQFITDDSYCYFIS